MGPVSTVAIIGAGALGGAYAAMIEDARPGAVHLVASGDRAARLSSGLSVNGKVYHIPVDEPGSAQPRDLLIVGVKHHHLEQALRDMERSVGENTTILSIMNGIESEERLIEAYGMERVLYCVALGIDAVREDGAIRYAAKGRLFLGEATNTPVSSRVQRIADFLESVHVPCEIPGDMRRTLWWKFMINVGINQLSAVLRAPYGVFHASEEARALLVDVMREVVVVAAAEGISLGDQDIEAFLEVLKTLHPTGKTSMLQDVESGRKTEVEMFAGKIVSVAGRRGIRVPLNTMLLRLIGVIEGSLGGQA